MLDATQVGRRYILLSCTAIEMLDAKVAAGALHLFPHSSCNTIPGTVTDFVVGSRQHDVSVGTMRGPHTLSSSLHMMKTKWLCCRYLCYPDGASAHYLALQHTQCRPHHLSVGHM